MKLDYRERLFIKSRQHLNDLARKRIGYVKGSPEWRAVTRLIDHERSHMEDLKEGLRCKA
jgi:hypothetical protein